MKYKFHETPLEDDYDEFTEFNERPVNNTNKYLREICWIAKNLNLDVTKFKINDFLFSEAFILYDNKYFGYLDHIFYLAFNGVSDYTFQDWWEFDN